jgi:hypothetical protein
MRSAKLANMFLNYLRYEYTSSEASGVSGQLYVAAAGEELPAYFLFRH